MNEVTSSEGGRSAQSHNRQQSRPHGGERRRIEWQHRKELNVLKKELANLQRNNQILMQQLRQEREVNRRGGSERRSAPQSESATDLSRAGSPNPNFNRPHPRQADGTSNFLRGSSRRQRRAEAGRIYRESVQPVEERPSVPTLRRSTATGATPKPSLRRMTKVCGASEEATLVANSGGVGPEDPNLSMPVKAVHFETIILPKPKVGGEDLKSRNIKTPGLRAVPGRALPIVAQPRTRKRRVDEELYGFLIYEFMFIARTAECMLRMSTRAKRYLADFDLTEFTHNELYEMVVEAVEAAMHIPSVEMRVRSSLQNYDSSVNRNAHEAMVRHGDVGSASASCLFPFDACFVRNKAVRLPKS